MKPCITLIFVICCLLTTLAEMVSAYPHNLAYFNWLSGGPDNGHRHLLHSSLDWEQDLIFLREWIAHHPQSSRVTFVTNEHKIAQDLGLAASVSFGELPANISGEWFAIRISESLKRNLFEPQSNRFAVVDDEWTRFLKRGYVADRVGKSIIIFHVRRSLGTER